MASSGHRRRALQVVLTALALGAVAIPSAGADDDDVAPEEDNPPGCATATAEDQEQCGAQGRDHFGQAEHRPPIEACADSTAPSGSRITRIVPDGPRRDDGSLAFVSGACVYLPPGYATSGLRYPVVHVLHGGGGDQADWVSFGDIQGILDRAAADDPFRAVIAVMPDGRSGQWFDWEDSSFLIERYVLDHLVPYVDTHFRTIPDRAGRALVGLSNGGYGALHLAGKRPDLFVAAGGMSSNLGARTMRGLGEEGAVHYQGSLPYQLAENYDQVDLILDVAVRCTSPDPFCATIVVDLLFVPDHLAFERRMEEVEHKGELDVRYADGAHQFTWWSAWLEERQLPFLQARLADPRPGNAPVERSRTPVELRYRTIAPEFSVWDYDVRVEREVREFLDLRAVTAGGFEIQGSGRATVVTAAHYRRGREYVVTGAGPGDETTTVTADRDGRLTIDVDLGPSHTAEQFTTEADNAEAAGGYWTVRTVTVAAAPDGPPVGDAPPPVLPTAATERGRPDGAGAAAAVVTEVAGTATADDDGRGAANARGRAEQAMTPVSSVSPQLVPTVLFILTLAAAPAVVWTRRRRTSTPEAT